MGTLPDIPAPKVASKRKGSRPKKRRAAVPVSQHPTTPYSPRSLWDDDSGLAAQTSLSQLMHKSAIRLAKHALEVLDSLHTSGMIHNTTRPGLVLVVDDVDKADEASLRLLAELSSIPKIRLLCSLQPSAENAYLRTVLTSGPVSGAVKLLPMRPRTTLAFARRQLGVATPLPELLNTYLLETTSGNPLLCREICAVLIASRAIEVSTQGVMPVVRLLKKLDTVVLSESCTQVFSSRVDLLDAQLSMTLKIASIIGLRFTCNLLKPIFPVVAQREQLHTDVYALYQHGFIVPENITGSADKFDDNTIWTFSNGVLHRAVYNMTLHSHRQQLHRQIAELLEAAIGDRQPTMDECDLLVRHWSAVVQERHSVPGSGVEDAALPLQKLLRYSGLLIVLKSQLWKPDSPTGRAVSQPPAPRYGTLTLGSTTVAKRPPALRVAKQTDAALLDGQLPPLTSAIPRPSLYWQKLDLAIRVVVVEEDLVSRSLLLRMLKVLGLTADVVTGSWQAVLAVPPSDYDLMLIDLTLPHAPSTSAAEQLVAKFQGNMALVEMTLTVFSKAKDPRPAVGLDGLLTKPLTLNQLYLTITQLFPTQRSPRKRPHSPQSSSGSSSDRAGYQSDIEAGSDNGEVTATSATGISWAQLSPSIESLSDHSIGSAMLSPFASAQLARCESPHTSDDYLDSSEDSDDDEGQYTVASDVNCASGSDLLVLPMTRRSRRRASVSMSERAEAARAAPESVFDRPAVVCAVTVVVTVWVTLGVRWLMTRQRSS